MNHVKMSALTQWHSTGSFHRRMTLEQTFSYQFDHLTHAVEGTSGGWMQSEGRTFFWKPS